MKEFNWLRTGYKKLISVLDSCETEEQFNSWNEWAEQYFDQMDQILHRYQFSFWRLRNWKKFRVYFEEMNWILQDVQARRQTIYDALNTPETRTTPVITGFQY